MKEFYADNKWYIWSVVAALVLALGYLWFASGPNNLLPEVYSVM